MEGQAATRVASRLSGAAERLALVAGSIVVTLALIEGALRLTGVGADPGAVKRIANTKGLDVKPDTTTLLCFPNNPRRYFDIDLRDPATRDRYLAIGMRNMDRVLPGNPFAVESHFNSHGYRDGEFAPRRPGVRRVVVMGDSFTEGWGVKERDTYPRVLERALERAEPGEWEVLNCGRANSDFPRLLFDLKRSLQWQPDIVVYGMVLNDPEMAPRIRNVKPHVQTNLMRRSGPSSGPFRLVDLVQGRLQERETRAATISWYRSLFTDENPKWKDTKDQIRGMDRMVRERGGTFVVAVWPMLLGIEGDYPLAEAHRTIAQFCAKFGIRHADLLEALTGQRSADLWVHRLDMHPNERADRLVGEYLFRVVRPLGRLSSPEVAARAVATPPHRP